MTAQKAKCGKREYRSARAAKAAHRRAHFRIRAYRCEECGWWHVAAAEKEGAARG